MMNETKKIPKSFIIFLAVVLSVILTVGLILLFLVGYYNYQDVLNDKTVAHFQKEYGRNSNMAYWDDFNVTISGNSVVYSDISENENRISVVYVTDKYVYYLEHGANSTTTLSRVDHSYENVEILHQTKRLGSFRMPDENTFFYELNGETYLYEIQSSSLEKVSSDVYDEYVKVNLSYDIERFSYTNNVFSKRNGFVITNNSTGEKRTVDDSTLEKILQTEQGEYLDKVRNVEIINVSQSGEDIYITCRSGIEFAAVYKYGFENDEVEFADWILVHDVLNLKVFAIK